MEVVVLVVLAGAVMALGGVVAGLVAVLRAIGDARRAVRATGERLGPLLADLEAEQATTQLELDALQRRLARERADRAP